MNLYVVTQRDPVFVDRFFRYVDLSIFEEVYIFDAPNFGGGTWKGFKKFLELFGPTKTMLSAIEGLFSLHAMPGKCELFRGSWEEIERSIIRHQPVYSKDILLSVSAPHKISNYVLDLFQMKFNFHGGKLPNYAGMMPLFWQRFHGLSHYTLTLHELAEEIDRGKILFEVDIPFEPSLLSTMKRNKEYSAIVFNLFMRRKLIESSRAPGPQTNFNKYPSSAAIKEFRRRFE